MANETLSDDSADNESIFEDEDNKFFHKGIVSNYRKEVVSHTSGEISISGVRRLPSGHIEGGGGGGSVSTTHYHTTYFDIGNKSFAWEGSNPISNGDEVALCSTPMTNGYNYVECLKNTTKGLFFKKDYKEDDTYIACCKKFGWFALSGLLYLFGVMKIMELNLENGKVLLAVIVVLLPTTFSIVGYFILSKVVPKRMYRVIIVLVALSVLAVVFLVAVRFDNAIIGKISGLMIVSMPGILGLEVISLMKDIREIKNSAKIINDAVLEC